MTATNTAYGKLLIAFPSDGVHYLEILTSPPSRADYSAYQQQQQTANPYAGYSYGTQAATATVQPQASTATNDGAAYQASYPSASTNYGSATYTSTTYAPTTYASSSYATTMATAAPPTAYGQTSYAGYTAGTTVASYSTNVAASAATTGYQDPNITRSSADGAQATYAAQPPPPPQPPSMSAPQPPLGQVWNSTFQLVCACVSVETLRKNLL